VTLHQSASPIGARLIPFPGIGRRMVGRNPIGLCARPDDWAVREMWWALARIGHRLPPELGVIVFEGLAP